MKTTGLMVVVDHLCWISAKMMKQQFDEFAVNLQFSSILMLMKIQYHRICVGNHMHLGMIIIILVANSQFICMRQSYNSKLVATYNQVPMCDCLLMDNRIVSTTYDAYSLPLGSLCVAI